jgi:glycosyltransferase involved in cell wall biosynthesis
MALVLKRLTGVKYIFDMRGFWADERVDGGLWPRDGRMYWVAKWFERRFLLSADHVVSLTQAAATEMKSFPYLSERLPAITIIPTCADLDRFIASPVDPQESFILGYVGSVGTWYLFDSVLETFIMLRQSNSSARMLIVNHGGHAYIRERMLALAVPVDCVDLTSASHAQIPQLMSSMDAGIFFYKPSYSRAACAPTKLAEFLGCGIPCLSNTGVGDMAEILEGERVGVAVNSFSQDALRIGVERLLALRAESGMAARCRAVAEKHFSLEQGVRLYASVYDALEST